MISKQNYVYNFCHILALSLLVTLPFSFDILPNIGGFLQPASELLITFAAKYIFNLPEDKILALISDSTGMYIHVFNLLFISSIVALFVNKKINFIQSLLPYYLSLILLKYGWNKVFQYQFYFPEPNLLFTPLGQLDKDILYWSSMGTSRIYNIFMGIIEIIPAVLLLHKRTRFLGGLIAFVVLTNVFFINMSYDISVKIFSLFLLFISFLIIHPNLKNLYHFLTGKTAVNLTKEEPLSQKNPFYLRGILIVIIFSESLFIYAKNDFKLGNKSPKNELFGAYKFVNNNKLKHLFFHSKNYMITQDQEDKFKDQKFVTTQNQLVLSNGKKYSYKQKNDSLTLTNGSSILYLIKIDLDKIPLKKDNFNWTIDSYKNGIEK